MHRKLSNRFNPLGCAKAPCILIMRGAFVFALSALKVGSLRVRPLHSFTFMRLLFADDNQETCKLFELVFRIENIDAHFAHNGAEALEAVREEAEPFDVIVLDVEMPVMNGWSAFKAIRELPQGQDIPVVIFTGYATVESKACAKQLGAADIFFKPMMPDDLVSRLRKVVERN